MLTLLNNLVNFWQILFVRLCSINKLDLEPPILLFNLLHNLIYLVVSERIHTPLFENTRKMFCQVFVFVSLRGQVLSHVVDGGDAVLSAVHDLAQPTAVGGEALLVGGRLDLYYVLQSYK